MYRLLSAFINICIAPENWIILLLIWWILSKSKAVKKRLAIAIVVLFVVFGNEVIFTSMVNLWQPKLVTLPAEVSYEAGIVLGGISNFDKNRNGYFNGAADRFVETCILYKTGKIKKIIISGGSNQKDGPKDAQFQYKKMMELGIPAADIIVEDSSLNTFENAAFSKVKIDSLKLHPPFVLITSAMHMPRSERVFRKVGIQVIPYPCDFKVLEKKFSFTEYFIPSLNTLFSWNFFLKEIVGVLGYTVMKKA
ncbi:MAG TPA: YdcF family protein [Segetibacter sp.]|jgi:uncharacterized SAM-binding protein YcdF (DUF218 family)